MKTADTESNADMRTRFLHSEEGSIFAFGCCMLIIWIEAIILLSQLGHPLWFDMLKMGLAHVPVGRAAAISYAAQAGLHPALSAILAIYLDIMVLLIVYPILIFSYKNLLERHVLAKHVKEVFASAQKSVTRFRRFKMLGVFAFVWFPFWMTGIIVGAVLGFLLGLKTWVNLATVICGTISAIICWVYFIGKLFDGLGKINQAIPLIITLVVIILFATLRILKDRKTEDS